MPRTLTAKELREQFKDIWDGIPPDAEWYREGREPALRIWRAISWVERAEKENKIAEALYEKLKAVVDVDLDAKFIFYWIAFNAAYGQYKPINWDKESQNFPKSWEFGCIDKYLDNVLAIDVNKEISNTTWNMRYSILAFMGNRYVFRDLWDFHRAENDPTKWDGSSQEESFKKEYRDVEDALGNAYRVRDVLSILFKRIYTMRCQFFHGSSTWKSPLNREQVEHGAYIMECLIPLFVSVMINDSRMINDTNHNRWGDLQYPRYPDIQGH